MEGVGDILHNVLRWRNKADPGQDSDAVGSRDGCIRGILSRPQGSGVGPAVGIYQHNYVP